MMVQVTEVHEMMDNLLVAVNDNDEKYWESAKSHHDLVRHIRQPSVTDCAQGWYDKISKSRVPGTVD
jgi:hypothetical protein